MLDIGLALYMRMLDLRITQPILNGCCTHSIGCSTMLKSIQRFDGTGHARELDYAYRLMQSPSDFRIIAKHLVTMPYMYFLKRIGFYHDEM